MIKELAEALQDMLDADLYADAEGLCYFANSDTKDGKAAVAKARAVLAKMPKPPKDPVVWACPDCKSSVVQAQMWVMANTHEVLDDTERYYWCNNCESEDEDGAIGDGEKKSLIELKWSETKEGKEGQQPPENLI